jgi:hypothetical protein
MPRFLRWPNRCSPTGSTSPTCLGSFSHEHSCRPITPEPRDRRSGRARTWGVVAVHAPALRVESRLALLQRQERSPQWQASDAGSRSFIRIRGRSSGSNALNARRQPRAPSPRVERPPKPFDLTPDPDIRVTMRDDQAIVRVSIKSTTNTFPDEEPFRRPLSWLLAEASERLRDEARRASIGEARQGPRYEVGGRPSLRESVRRVAR